MAAGVVLTSQSIRLALHVKHTSAPLHREPRLVEARTRCASTATPTRTALDGNPDHLLHSLEQFGNGKVRVSADGSACASRA